MRLRTLAAATATALLAASTLAGCGSSDTPAETVPAVGASLDKVDAAISAGRLAQARTELKALIATTTQARQAGDLSDQDATNILDAAQALLAELPASKPASPSATPTPTPTPQPKEEKGHGKDKKGKGHGNDEGDD